jgi:DNA polymerase-3 subunit delta
VAAARSSQTKIEKLGFNDARPASVVLVSGPEHFLASRAMRTIREALRTTDASLEIHDIEASGYAKGELFTYASPSLFAEPRLIRVSGVEQSSDAFIEDAKRYLAQPAEDTTLILRHAGGMRGKALLDAVRGAPGGAIGAIEVVCAEVKKDADRLSFVQSEFRGGLGELAGAIEQLVSDVGQRISEAEVERLTEGRVEAGAFKVADAATAGRTADALLLLRQALSTGGEPIPLLAALNMKVRAMARVYGARGSSGELASALGMAPWQVDRAQKETRGWSEGDLARAIDLAAETELALKGGSRDPVFALERYVLFIARRGATSPTR